MITPLQSVPPETETDLGHAFVETVARDDRQGMDRRRRPTPMLSRYSFFGGRRKTVRRADDDPRQFVDQYGTGLFTIAVSIVALNFLDAWFTIYFLSHGGTELNPLVDAVIRMGVGPFIALKSVGIGFCVVILMLTKNFTVSRVGLMIVFLGYAALLGWHLYLLDRVPA